MQFELKSIKRKLLRTLRAYFIKSNKFSILYFINCQIYKTIGYLIKKYYSGIPGVTSIYLVHGLTLDELYPGLSDFDLAIVYKSTPNEGIFYGKLRSRWKKIQSFVSARDLLLFTENEFELWQKFGGGWEPLDELAHWKLLYGKELRLNKPNITKQQAEKDRLKYSLSKFPSLLATVIKEEPNSPFITTTLRRNLYKNFCYSVFSTNKKYLLIRRQYSRLSQWAEENSDINGVIRELLKIRRSKFQEGNISTYRFRIGAYAYLIIDKYLENLDLSNNLDLTCTPPSEMNIPIYNLDEVEQKIKKFCSSIIGMLGNNIESIILSSNGSPMGYMLFVILKDGLNQNEVEEVFKTLHVIFRIYDDPWFNEHFPAKAPIVYSKNMFAAHMQSWPFHRNNSLKYRFVIFGKDLLVSLPGKSKYSDDTIEEDILREKINLTRSFHQIVLEKNKAALYDFITLQYPRLNIIEKINIVPGTVDEALYYYEMNNGHERNHPKTFFEKYGRKSVHDLAYALSETEFEEGIEFLKNKLSDEILIDVNFSGRKLQ